MSNKGNKPKMSGVNQLPSIDNMFKEDDDDFTPAVGSNLAAIFGTPQKSQENTRINSPARHGSQRQGVGDQIQPQVSNAKKEVILAKAVHAFKLQNGQYVPIGKVGIALIGNIVTKQYDVILYKGTQTYLSMVAVTCNFSYAVQIKNYASYYDTNKDNWSILFENNESSTQFAREICISRYLSRPSKTDNNVIYQDLSEVSKNATAKEGDGISIKYVTSLDINQPLKIDNNLKQTITLEISKDDNWERLLIGTSMGLRRIMILPSNKQIGLGPGFPKDRDMIMEIEVVSLFTKDELAPQIGESPEIKQKATIISRMAKMGQSILPKVPLATTTDSEDTEDEVFHKATRHKRVETIDIPVLKKHSSPHATQPLDAVSQKKVLNRAELIPSALPISQRSVVSAPVFAPQWAAGQIQQQYVSIDGQLLPMQHQTITQPTSASMDPSLNVFLSEARTQNTELRMGLSKIGDNVQKLLDKFHVLELQQASTSPSDKSLEATLKMFIDVNKSKQHVGTKYEEIDSISKASALPADENKQLCNKLNAVEDELKQANESLRIKSDLINEMMKENDALKGTHLNNMEKLEEKLIASENRIKELSNAFEQSEDRLRICREQNVQLENHITELTSKCKALEENASKTERNHCIYKSKVIKDIMKDVFRTLCESFREDDYTTEEIQTIIYSTLRYITTRIMKGDAERQTETEEAGRNKEYEQDPEFTTNDHVDEKATVLPELPQDILNPTVPGFNKNPPPVPKFDVESCTSRGAFI